MSLHNLLGELGKEHKNSTDYNDSQRICFSLRTKHAELKTKTSVIFRKIEALYRFNLLGT